MTTHIYEAAAMCGVLAALLILLAIAITGVYDRFCDRIIAAYYDWRTDRDMKRELRKRGEI